MRAAATYRGERKRAAKRERIPWRNVQTCKVSTKQAIVTEDGEARTGRARLMKMIPTHQKDGTPIIKKLGATIDVATKRLMLK